MKQGQMGICVEPAAKVNSTFLRGNVSVIPYSLPSQVSTGHSPPQKFWWTYPELQVLPDFYPVLFARTIIHSLKLVECQMVLSQVVL